MPSIRLPESIAKLSKTSNTTLSFPSSIVNIGAKQYKNISALTLSTSVSGVGGLDASLTASSLYYVYAVVSSGVMTLIGSLNSSLPSGYTQAKQIGQFYVNASSQIATTAVGQFDSISEYTSGAKISFLNTLNTDTINEYTTNNGVQILNRKSGSAIASGYAGEMLLASGGAIQLASTAVSNILALSVPAGVWLISASMVYWDNYLVNNGGVITICTHTSSATLNGNNGNSCIIPTTGTQGSNNKDWYLSSRPAYYIFSGTTTVYSIYKNDSNNHVYTRSAYLEAVRQ